METESQSSPANRVAKFSYNIEYNTKISLSENEKNTELKERDGSLGDKKSDKKIDTKRGKEGEHSRGRSIKLLVLRRSEQMNFRRCLLGEKPKKGCYTSSNCLFL